MVWLGCVGLVGGSGMAEVVLEMWGDPGDVDEVIAWLVKLPMEPKVKKYALHEWCLMVGVEMTGEMVERVTGLPAGEI